MRPICAGLLLLVVASSTILETAGRRQLQQLGGFAGQFVENPGKAIGGAGEGAVDQGTKAVETGRKAVVDTFQTAADQLTRAREQVDAAVRKVNSVTVPDANVILGDTDLGKALVEIGKKASGIEAAQKLAERLKECTDKPGTKVVMTCITALAAEHRKCNDATVKPQVQAKYNAGVAWGNQFGEEHYVEAAGAVVAGGLTGGAGLIAWLSAELVSQFTTMKQRFLTDPALQCQAALFNSQLMLTVAENIARGKLQEAFTMEGFEVVIGVQTLSCRYEVPNLGWTDGPNNFLPYVGLRKSADLKITGNGRLDSALTAACASRSAAPLLGAVNDALGGQPNPAGPQPAGQLPPAGQFGGAGNPGNVVTGGPQSGNSIGGMSPGGGMGGVGVGGMSSGGWGSGGWGSGGWGSGGWGSGGWGSGGWGSGNVGSGRGVVREAVKSAVQNYIANRWG